MADFYDTPFSLDELRAAMDNTHHNWNWMFPPPWKDVVRSEIGLFTSSSHIDFASDSARNREIWTILGAVFAHALETGYRLGGGDPGGPDE